jgi:hypothetical protein
LLLTLGVVLAHLWLAGQVLPDRLGGGATEPERIEVAFVSELAPAAPAAVAPSPPPAPRPARALAPEPAASSPEPAASSPETKATPVSPVPEMADAPASAAAVAEVAPEMTPPAAAPASEPATSLAVAPAPAGSAPLAVSAPHFEWPPSTRLSYRLTGEFRGPVEGQAQVEWLRDGDRYQVRLDVGVGPAFAPLLSRRTSSEGLITAEGLRPDRFDEATRVLMREPRRQQIEMSGETVRLANGNVVARPGGLQDTASQFVQLSWLFRNRPELLRAGQTVPMPLALPRRVQLWQYEVGESMMLDTPAGPVEAVHVRPRPEVAGDARRVGELVPEAWFAPSLQYLPVRILIRQEGGNFVDLMLERLPQQATPGR